MIIDGERLTDLMSLVIHRVMSSGFHMSLMCTQSTLTHFCSHVLLACLIEPYSLLTKLSVILVLLCKSQNYSLET